jgi:dimethylargininase
VPEHDRKTDVAILRGVSPSIARCELTYLRREPIDLDRAVAQHDAYAALMRDLGLEVVEIRADAALPDCCFVEDVAVVLDGLALLTRPGAESRRGEVPAVEEVLARFRPLARIEPPATLEGGDVLTVGRTLFVGRSPRTNAAGVDQLRALVEPLGYRVVPVPVIGCLHLKSAVTALDDEHVLANTAWIDPAPLREMEIIPVAPEEPGAANVLRVHETVVAHPGFPRTLERMAERGYDVRSLDVSEFLKAEAALTCKSLLFRREARATGPPPRTSRSARGSGRPGAGGPRARGRAG